MEYAINEREPIREVSILINIRIGRTCFPVDGSNSFLNMVAQSC